MQEAVAARAPAHFWIVGLLALFWNGFGACDYTMTRMESAAWITALMPGTDPNAFFQWIGGFPVWASFGWGLGVWGGLVGAVLLLMRKRHAVAAFAASTIGAVLGLGYQIMNAPPFPGMDTPAAKAMPAIIILIALGLLLYARAMEKRGLLH